MRRTALLGLVALLGLPACGLGGGDTQPALEGPVMRYPQSASSAAGMAAEVRGRLELVGDCLYVALDEVGERYPIVWPAGTRWDGERRAVLSPAGVAMPIGSEVVGGGGYLDVAEVEASLGSEAGALAAHCVDNAYGEVAFVNNAGEAIGPAG